MIKNIEIFNDGSGATGICEVGGFKFAMNYTNKLSVSTISKFNNFGNKERAIFDWSLRKAKEEFLDRLNLLIDNSWINNNQQIYSE